ncbi:MAG TPA: type II toxin-antitoxin system VapC family toxin [Vicinamibacterales bacterium]|nr:type II toxin-antitoxin system VapC family toxin [Vicinamibacterales bacterium]
MTIHIDTSALVDALTGPRRSLDVLIRLAGEGHRLSLSAIVLYEWLRGPRRRDELAAQEELFPRERIVPFGPAQAAAAAKLYAAAKRPRGREIDLAIAACALHDGAALWTLNREDFRDLPGLTLV